MGVISESATASEPSAHSNETDFGAENVRSNAFTDRGFHPASSASPLRG
jgi:hypothetical protein